MHTSQYTESSNTSSIASPSRQSKISLDAFNRPAETWQADEAMLGRIRESIEEIATRIAPVWPLADYVAVNPWAGMTSRSFLEARHDLKTVSKIDSLMPLSHYRAAWASGRFGIQDLEAALTEWTQVTRSTPTASWTATDIQTLLTSPNQEHPSHQTPAKPTALTISAWIDQQQGTRWHSRILNEIGKICAAHYDEGQSRWNSPWKHLSLYHAWLRMNQHDRRMEIEGVHGFRKFVANLPEDAEQALAFLIQSLQLPEHTIESFLLTHAYSTPGWCAWVLQKQRASIAEPEPNASELDLAGLLTIRLAHEISLLKNDANVLEEYVAKLVNWQAHRSVVESSHDAQLRLVLLRATEIAETRQLLQTIAVGIPVQKTPLADTPLTSHQRSDTQMVFCIDVRSERIRKHLEAIDAKIETFGFAGFFGLPFEYVPMEQVSGSKQVPPLLHPKFRIFEGLPKEHSELATAGMRKRIDSHLLAHHLQRLKESSIACFAFVEAVGLGFTWNLLKKTFRWKAGKQSNSQLRCSNAAPGPTLRGLNQQGLTTTRQIDLAEGMLRGIGLIHSFAPTVIFCGHESETNNNPLQAGLDCGACGGHSGQVNAQVAALLLNQTYVRNGLAERGITIPSDTTFFAAVHNTTTDAITIHTDIDLSAANRGILVRLEETCRQATRCSQSERLVTLEDAQCKDLIRRSRDWSEVRPEWGLAGNFAFLAAPRSWTKNVSLGGRVFLHSYDSSRDPSGEILEQIMTAPMIVAHWINMQYYASTVCPEVFGSESKTLHNVVGRFGVLSGNGGDLRTGLPWQSISLRRNTQKGAYHSPLRLSVFLSADRERIDTVISKHPMIAQMIENQWLHLYAIDERECWHSVPYAGWQPASGFSQ